MARYYFGQIIGASIDDGRGRTNDRRPAVIIGGDKDYAITGEILVVPITKRRQDPCPPYHVQVHDGHARDAGTGLYYPCWAKCNWARWLAVERIKSSWGHMPDDLLDRIVAVFDQLSDDDAFDDWQ